MICRVRFGEAAVLKRLNDNVQGGMHNFHLSRRRTLWRYYIGLAESVIFNWCVERSIIIIINVNKHVYYEKQQTLANGDSKGWHFKTVYKLYIEYFCSLGKFEIPERSCSSQRHSFPNSYNKMYFKESFSTFHVTFVKTINVEKNNKRVY